MKSDANTDFLSVRELAAMLVSMRKVGVADRALVIRLLGGAMQRFPQFLGLWCVFEPEAFDGRDAEFRGRKGHDAAGRFTPRWERHEGRLRFGRSCGHDSPSLGGWYHFARDSRQEIVFGPYDEQVLTGLPILCLSRVAPILERGRFIGAVGVDISLDALRATGKAHADPSLEAMIGRWHVFLSGATEIEFASRTARRLLARYVGPCRQGRLPEALREQLADGGAPTDFRFANAHGQLRIAVARHPHTGGRILSLEVAEARGASVGGAAISLREQEVLEWVEQGKSNAEIALILGISEHTVRHHLERIFAKLGVENRRAAMLCAQAARPFGKERILSRIPLAP